jgi:hypothetical protein
MRTLATLTSKDLGRLLIGEKSAIESDYSLLARAIMNSPTKGQGDSPGLEDERKEGADFSGKGRH